MFERFESLYKGTIYKYSFFPFLYVKCLVHWSVGVFNVQEWNKPVWFVVKYVQQIHEPHHKPLHVSWPTQPAQHHTDLHQKSKYSKADIAPVLRVNHHTATGNPDHFVHNCQHFSVLCSHTVYHHHHHLATAPLNWCSAAPYNNIVYTYIIQSIPASETNMFLVGEKRYIMRSKVLDTIQK